PLHPMMAMKITWSYRDRADRLAARLTQMTGGGTRQPAHAQIRKLQIAPFETDKGGSALAASCSIMSTSAATPAVRQKRSKLAAVTPRNQTGRSASFWNSAVRIFWNA